MAYDVNKWTGNSLRNRPRRRWVAPALLVATIAEMVLGVVGSIGPDPASVVLFCAIVAIPVLYASPFAGGTLIHRFAKTDEDEFVASVMGRAMPRAYEVVTGLALTIVFWMALHADLGVAVPETSRGWTNLAFAFFAIAVLVPTLFAEWAVPISRDDEDERQI